MRQVADEDRGVVVAGVAGEHAARVDPGDRGRRTRRLRMRGQRDALRTGCLRPASVALIVEVGRAGGERAGGAGDQVERRLAVAVGGEAGEGAVELADVAVPRARRPRGRC